VTPAQQSLDGVAGREPSKNDTHGNKDEITSEHVMSSIWRASNVIISMHKTIRGTKRARHFFPDILISICVGFPMKFQR
jgi:hypothetical protein